MRSVETEGGTIDEAIARALELLHIERERVDVEILENSSRGLLGFGGKPARIRATVRNPLASRTPSEGPPVSAVSTAPAVSRETPAIATTPMDPATAADSVATAGRALEVVLRELGVAPPPSAVPAEDGTWRFVIEGDGAGIVIGRHGQTLDAIEYLMSRIASHQAGNPVRIALDVEGYRERRQESLEQTARRAADKARATGRPVTLSPMSPRDRRIVHVALSDEHGVTTRSQGEGGFRRVVVVPDRSAGRPTV
jgi:spoIIIJ-associated protein